jgi:phospholipid-translocating ATPase
LGIRLTFSSSWTIITWVIIPGSSVVLLVWIVIYSFFESFAFVHEVQRLLGGITFWVAVALSVAIALRKLTVLASVLCSLGFSVPRILVKFVSTSFATQDVDIVRFMWVKGNLKDSLGIRRRNNEIVFVDAASSDPEVMPMFRRPHMSSTSEMLTTEDIHELGLPRGFGDRTPPTRVKELNANAPQINAISLTSSGPPHAPLLSTATVGEEDTMATPTSLARATHAAAMSPSPQPSNYSVSDIPMPSTVPSPGSYEPSQYPGVVPISYSRPLRGQYAPHSENVRSPPNTYEMQVHSPKFEESSNLSERREVSGLNEAVTQTERSNRRHSQSPNPTALRTSTLSTTNDGPVAL